MLSPCGLATTRTLNSYRYDAYARITENDCGRMSGETKRPNIQRSSPQISCDSCALESFRRASFAPSSDERKSKCAGYDRSRTSHVDKSNPKEGMGNLHVRACRPARRGGAVFNGGSVLRIEFARFGQKHKDLAKAPRWGLPTLVSAIQALSTDRGCRRPTVDGP